ncbi:hypothetical protein ACIBQ6_16265 [Nonomuraea sp. NPDC049655]|uniref:hypothetical protein n=1 Tax=Nonomuraea sp. NPDC049655 TaxID=3364355 RepID=UPI0037BAAA4B
MAMLRLFAIGLLAGAALCLYVWPPGRGEGFQQARLSTLMALEIGQFVTVPIALVGGLVLAVKGAWARTPGYLLGTVTTLFGVLVATQAWAMGEWVETGPPGIGDPDGESVLAFLGLFSGAVTTVVGLSILMLRWSGYDSSTVPVRQRRPRRRK